MNKKEKDFKQTLQTGKEFHPLNKKTPPEEIVSILEEYRGHRKRFKVGSRKRVGITLFTEKLKGIFPDCAFGRIAIQNWMIKKDNEEKEQGDSGE